MRRCFITGTDTGVGKTLICGLLGKYLLGKGYSTVTQKWAQTGEEGLPEDTYAHLRLMDIKKEEVKKDLFSLMAPYVFKLPASPHLAAEKEDLEIDIDKIKESFNLLSTRFDSVIVEGIGGCLVPFNRKDLLVDIAKELSLPVLVVVANKLGAINHTLLTVEALRRRSMEIIGIIFNGQEEPTDELVLKDNKQIIEELTGENVLGDLPWSEEEDFLHSSFADIGDNIMTTLNSRASK